MSFWQWLKKQKRRDDPVGDLARDVLSDADVRKYRSIEKMLAYLQEKPEFVKGALKRAIIEYVDFCLNGEE